MFVACGKQQPGQRKKDARRQKLEKKEGEREYNG
jgi:hypothetical protein